MKSTRTLLTAALSLVLTTAAVADQPVIEVPEAVPFEGPIHVMKQGPDGVIRCEAVDKPNPVIEVEDGVEPLPWYTHAVMTNNQFAFDLYGDLAGQADLKENIFFSPISITAALSLTYEGAEGNTRSQFEKVLHVNPGIERNGYHSSLSELLEQLDGKDKPYALSVANSLWGEQSMPFREAFLKTLEKNYDAGFEAVDFKRKPDVEREKINAWVEEKTQDRIKDLLPEGSIDSLTRLVLANAIYFKGSWQYQFEPDWTQDRPFHQIGAEASKTPTMMLPNKHLRYADLDGLDILEMPYKSGDLSMLVLLPDERDGLAKLEGKLSNRALNQWVSEMKRGPVRVLLPKWESTLSTKLVPTLQRLGLTDAFDENKADFTGITDSAEGELLYITDVFHKAFIKVDETGSEAAAATAVVIGAQSAPPRPYEFKADHPFVYIIRDNRTGAVLFLGRMADPS